MALGAGRDPPGVVVGEGLVDPHHDPLGFGIRPDRIARGQEIVAGVVSLVGRLIARALRCSGRGTGRSPGSR